MKNEIFADLKVVELASVLAGPNVGQFFAELGAEVIKVENLKTGGDITRTWRGKSEGDEQISAYFSSVNWGKKSLAIDLQKPEGKEIVSELASRADIVIASYKPGDAEKLGVDYKSLAKNNRSLIYGQVTGYGRDNERVGYDALIQAESGFMDMNGEPDGLPLKMPVALVDILAAHHLKEGILLGLIKKEKTGAGDLVEVSLMQAAISSLTNQATNWLMAKHLPKRQGSAHPNIAPYGENYITKDKKRVILAIGSDRQFQDLCNILALSELGYDPHFSKNTLRVRNREALNKKLQERIADIEAVSFLNQCNQMKIPVGIIQNLQEVFEMAEAKETVMRNDEILGVRTVVSHSNGRLPVISHILPPPLFGQHSALILEQTLGFNPEKVAQLRSNNVIN